MTNAAPDVSIIIPVYNTELYIRECLESALNQTHKNIEIICINDGSTDSSYKLLLEYKFIDSRIKVINIPHQGLSIARNAGIYFAKGKYIYFIDSDDYIERDAIELMFKKSESESLELLAVGMTPFSEDSAFLQKVNSKKEAYQISGDYPTTTDGKALLSSLLTNKDFRVSACVSFVSRSFLLKNNIYFPPHILHEDNIYSYQIYLAASRAGAINDPIYNRRFRKNSIVTSPASFDKFYGQFISYLEMKNAALKNKLYEEDSQILLLPIIRIRRNTMEYYLKLKKEEKCKIDRLSKKEHFIFHVEFSDDLKVRSKLKKLSLEMENLQKSSSIKTEELDTNYNNLSLEFTKLSNDHNEALSRLKKITSDHKNSVEKYKKLTSTCNNAQKELHKISKLYIVRLIVRLHTTFNKLAIRINKLLRGEYFCPCCCSSFDQFTEFPYYLHKQQYNESLYCKHAENTICPCCNSLPRHRIICDYLNKNKKSLKNKKILAFAIEKGIKLWLDRKKCEYISADLTAKADIKIDIQNINLPDDSFDIIICNHVLEHVEDYSKALTELYRVLKPQGTLIVSVPQWMNMQNTYEDPRITAAQDRKKHFGQVDHLRVFGNDFPELLKKAGFSVSAIDLHACSRKIRPVVGPANYDSNIVHLGTK